MPVDNSKGENLIFVISQPRAGSTMLQKVLGAHPEIYTVSEPWIAMHPLSALREQGITADFDHRTARRAVQEFLRHLPDREGAYWEGVRRMLAYLYNRALEGSGKTIFLDKTPRYYLVIPELQRVFPHARFVFLLRNPVAVLSSILETWVKSTDDVRMSHFRYDLMAAPRLILEGIRASGSSAIVTRYEELTSTPEAAVHLLCENLGIAFSPSMIDYGAVPAHRERWAYGDQGTVYDESRPVADRAERWRQVLKQSPKWEAWAHDYLTALGPGIVGDMGYSYEDLCAVLTAPDTRDLKELRRDPAATELRWEEPGPLNELAEVRGLLAERTGDLERAVEDLRARTAELVEARGLLVDRTRQLEGALAGFQAESERVNGENEVLRGDLLVVRADLVDRTRQLEGALSSSQAESERVNGENDVLRGDLLAVRAELVDRTRQLEESLASFQAESERVKGENDILRGDLLAVRADLVDRTRQLEESLAEVAWWRRAKRAIRTLPKVFRLG